MRGLGVTAFLKQPTHNCMLVCLPVALLNGHSVNLFTHFFSKTGQNKATLYIIKQLGFNFYATLCHIKEFFLKVD